MWSCGHIQQLERTLWYLWAHTQKMRQYLGTKCFQQYRKTNTVVARIRVCPREHEILYHTPGVDKSQPIGHTHHSDAFVNKVLLEHHCLHIAWMLLTGAELNSCKRTHGWQSLEQLLPTRSGKCVSRRTLTHLVTPHPTQRVRHRSGGARALQYHGSTICPLHEGTNA
jgi:hypothetical protein